MTLPPLRPLRPLYIFDLDGTLALIEHRRHFLERDTRDKWRHFYAACDKDQPNEPVIATMERLRHAGADVWIFSGRSDEVRDKTVAWLAHHTSFMMHDLEGLRRQPTSRSPFPCARRATTRPTMC